MFLFDAAAVAVVLFDMASMARGWTHARSLPSQSVAVVVVVASIGSSFILVAVVVVPNLLFNILLTVAVCSLPLLV